MEHTAHVYEIAVGSYGSREQETLFHFQVDFEKKEFRKRRAVKGLLNPSYLTLGKDRTRLYAVEEDPQDGFLAVLDWAKEEPTLLYEEHVGGGDPCHVVLDEQEEFLAVSSFSAEASKGSFHLYRLDEEGTPVQTDSRRPEGKGGNPRRQQGSHCHFMAFHENRTDGCDFGTDTLFSFDLDRENGKWLDSPRTLKLPAGSGPRHLCFSKKDPHWFYLIGELDAKVRLFHLEEGGYRSLQLLDSLPVDTPAEIREFNRSSAIKMTEDEQYLFVTNRLDDSVTLFRIEEDHQLSLLDICKSGSAEPRELTVLGDYLLIGHQEGHCIQAFRLDRKAEKLVKLDMKLEMEAAPVCIVEF